VERVFEEKNAVVNRKRHVVHVDLSKSESLAENNENQQRESRLEFFLREQNVSSHVPQLVNFALANLNFKLLDSFVALQKHVGQSDQKEIHLQKNWTIVNVIQEADEFDHEVSSVESESTVSDAVERNNQAEIKNDE